MEHPMLPEGTVHIVDDEADVREALALLVRSVGLAAASYASAYDFLQRYRPGAAGCAVFDVRMPGMSGLDLQEKLRRDGIALPIIFMTGHGDVPMAVRAMRAGALDFIEKPFNDQEMLDRIQAAIARDAEARDAAADLRQVAARHADLTPREREVMQLIVAGRLNKQIADELGLSTRTVELHRAHLMEKMQADSLSHLVRMALALEDAERSQSR
ncbi:MAG: response regulator transcription factor [Rhodocyclaceae bacterium]|nr:response regulator transcription factor [Rhodocyclaceae bacterium]MBX3669821.1 response regulator transcription factor [Rhodocyclaceae bacterium]